MLPQVALEQKYTCVPHPQVPTPAQVRHSAGTPQDHEELEFTVVVGANGDASTHGGIGVALPATSFSAEWMHTV